MGFGAEFGWRRFAIDGSRSGETTLWFRGHVHGREPAALAAEVATLAKEADAIGRWLDGLDGHFALVATGPDWAFAAVDPVRSLPLIWARDGDAVIVDHDGPRMAARLGLSVADIDPDMAAAVALSGFTIGDATLYPAVRQLGPGEALVLTGGSAAVHRYHRWTPWLPRAAAPADLMAPLRALNRQIIDTLIASADGRPILVPLSAGLDSRFVASGLAAAGYRDVRCVAYGLAGNREAEISRMIAARLGLPWTFVPYTQARLRRVFAGADHSRYKAYSDSLTGMHFPQEYLLLTEMMKHHGLTTDTIIVNGQAGDFIAGNHIPPALHQPAAAGDETARRHRVIDALLVKHYKSWAVLRTPARLARIARLLDAEITALGGMPADVAGDHGVYEYCEFQDRQSKYVLNGQRIYEYLGFDWRLPLWDRAYMDFWAAAPLTAKRGEMLYREALIAENWGGVWRDIPINPLRIRPGWLRPIRFAAKLAHAPLGRARWHRFEKRVFDYWMATTCAYAFVPYGRVAGDRRGHFSAIAWHIEDYLRGQGLAYDGTPRTSDG